MGNEHRYPQVLWEWGARDHAYVDIFFQGLWRIKSSLDKTMILFVNLLGDLLFFFYTIVRFI